MRPAALILLMVLSLWRPADAVDEAQERRIRSGLKLFRAVLSADEDITSKVDSSGQLLLLVMYAGNAELAKRFAEELRQLGKGERRGAIRGLPIDVQISNDQNLTLLKGRVPAGIYVVENLLEEQRQRLVNYGIDNHVIVYSPFKGDVTNGILCGLAIETRVRPYINLSTMRASNIRIRKFFLKVAKHYEP